MKELHDITLLYVEDDLQTQENMYLLLEDEVKDLYQAFNGKDALEFYYTKQPDIIITDINMPHLDGLNFARKIKALNEDQAIIIISGHGNQDNLMQSIDIGVDQFIQKPLDINILFDKIKKTIQKMDKIKAKNKQAYSDNLTNIYNRHYFNLSLEKAIEETKNANHLNALFFMDLDDLKAINDTFGHVIGDKVLQQVANNIQNIIHEGDTLARVGGDEFALIVKHIKNENEIERYAQKVADATNFIVEFDIDPSEFYVDEQAQIIHISCSIGICTFAQEATTQEDIMHCADVAMYKAKNDGKATYKIEHISKK